MKRFRDNFFGNILSINFHSFLTIFCLCLLAQQVIRDLLKILPDDTEARTISNPVIVNICGIFNNLVIGSVEAAREITENGGVSKLIQIKDSGDVR